MTCARIGFVDNAKTVLRIQAGAQGGWEGRTSLGHKLKQNSDTAWSFVLCLLFCCGLF